MDQKINICVEIDPACTVPQVIIKTSRKTEFVETLISAIDRCSDRGSDRIAVYDGYTAVFLAPDDIVRIYIKKRKITVCTTSGSYEARGTLQELEDHLDMSVFFRSSRSEIISLNKIVRYDTGVSGTARILFEDGSESQVARRRVREIQTRINAMYGR